MIYSMKQRIRVTAICKRGNEVLFLKRAGGRVEGLSNFELPTGKIVFGEQPDEAMARIVYEYTGVQAASLKLSDVVTFTDLRNSSGQGNLYVVYEVQLQNEDVKITSERYLSYLWASSEKYAELELDEASNMVLRITNSKLEQGTLAGRELGEADKNETAAQDSAIIYTDGGSRGNPGPSSLGYYIIDKNGREIKRGGEFLGFSSSRLAEYYGLKEGIEQAIELGLKHVDFRSDSLMLVNQMNGIYKVKNADLMQVHNDVLKLLEKLDSYSFMHVPRSQNVEADAEVNKILDMETRRMTY